MKKISQGAFFCFAFMFNQYGYALGIDSPVGYWKTIDDITGQEKSIIQIEESSNETVSGKIVKLFSDAEKTCTQCVGPKKNQPILGMVVMEGLKQNASNAHLWAQGEILDPKNGKEYHCNMQVMENGQKLQVRGFIGIPMFGRSQTWIRVEGQPLKT